MAKCYQGMKEYKKAIKSYKKVIEIAWKEKNKTLETKTYELIGIQLVPLLSFYRYYYLGEIEKTKYYHNRSSGG